MRLLAKRSFSEYRITSNCHSRERGNDKNEGQEKNFLPQSARQIRFDIFDIFQPNRNP